MIYISNIRTLITNQLQIITQQFNIQLQIDTQRSIEFKFALHFPINLAPNGIPFVSVSIGDIRRTTSFVSV